MLGTEPHTNHAGGNAAQDRPSSQQPQWPRKRECLRAGENPPDYSVLQQHLKLLHRASRKFAAPLHSAKVADSEVARGQLGSQYVGSRHRILNREIDSHPSNR